MSELKLEWRTIGKCRSRMNAGDDRGIAWRRETKIDWALREMGRMGCTSEGRETLQTFDTTTSAHSRWSDISVLVSLLICMSSSLSRSSPLLILVPVRPRAALRRVCCLPFSSLSFSLCFSLSLSLSCRDARFCPERIILFIKKKKKIFFTPSRFRCVSAGARHARRRYSTLPIASTIRACNKYASRKAKCCPLM
ncbi:hypothetical protein PUN28_002910 [Cardiocondyla obscurior]|uniref:Uncharacterized protein n=1 Tax=Cardiocondyla obscurior TaxID=286306 RepID=A0AAW2GWK5_9HYME